MARSETKQAVIAGTPDADLVREVEQFLYREARILDAEELEEWLTMLTEDIHYWMPSIQNRYRKDKQPAFSEETVALFEEDMDSLKIPCPGAPRACAHRPPIGHTARPTGKVQAQARGIRGKRSDSWPAPCSAWSRSCGGRA